MFDDNPEWQSTDRRLKDLFVAARESGDTVNRYISHREVMEVLFDGDAELLTHQFVEVTERGLVRNHSKSIRQSLEILVTNRDPREDKKESLRGILKFLEENKPKKGRNTKPIETGDTKRVRVNKIQGYVMVPSVAQIFGLEVDADGKYSNQEVLVEYESDTEIRIIKRTPLSDPDMLDDL